MNTTQNNNKNHSNHNNHNSLPLNYQSYPNYHINPTPFLSSSPAHPPLNNLSNTNNHNNNNCQSTTSSLSTFANSVQSANNSLSSSSSSSASSSSSSSSSNASSASSSSSHSNNNTPSIDMNQNTKNSSSNHANLRIDIKHNHHTAPPISHATRIPPTNLSYKELLRKHQFTPSGGSGSTSPMKQSFDTLHLDPPSSNNTNHHTNHVNINHINNTNHNNNHHPIHHQQYQHQHHHHHLQHHQLQPQQPPISTLEAEREAFRRKPIIEEPKKNVTPYQLFARWKRTQKQDMIHNGCPQAKAISIAWNELNQSEKDEWTKKSEQAKIQYHHQKEMWSNYVEEAKRLGIPVPTKSVKSIIQPIKIKNLLNLIPDISKFNKETTFIISKATEMFIQYYASKAIEISSKLTATMNEENDDDINHNIQLSISGQHCFDALQTDHKFNFLRAVTVQPTNYKIVKQKRKRTKRGVKRKLDTNTNHNNTSSSIPKSASINSNSSTSSSSHHSPSHKDTKIDSTETHTPSKKKRRLNNDSESTTNDNDINDESKGTATTTTTNNNPHKNNNTTLHPPNQIITNHDYGTTPTIIRPQHPYSSYMNGYNYYPPPPHHAYYPQQAPPHQVPVQQPPFSSIATTLSAPSSQSQAPQISPTTIYQPTPTPFHPNTFYNPHSITHPPPTNGSGGSQIVNVQQIFGSDD